MSVTVNNFVHVPVLLNFYHITIQFYILVIKYCANALWKRLYEDVIKRLIKHEAKPSALLGLETTSEYNLFRNAREYAVL